MEETGTPETRRHDSGEGDQEKDLVQPTVGRTIQSTGNHTHSSEST